VLINKIGHSEAMTALFLIAVLALCLLAPFFGADSRWRDDHDRPAARPRRRAW